MFVRPTPARGKLAVIMWLQWPGCRWSNTSTHSLMRSMYVIMHIYPLTYEQHVCDYVHPLTHIRAACMWLHLSTDKHTQVRDLGLPIHKPVLALGHHIQAKTLLRTHTLIRVDVLVRSPMYVCSYWFAPPTTLPSEAMLLRLPALSTEVEDPKTELPCQPPEGARPRGPAAAATNPT